MGQPRRPGIVTAAAVLGFIIAGLLVVAAIVVAVMGGAILSQLVGSELTGEEAATGAVVVAVIAGIVAVIAGVQILASVFILKGKNWARILQTVLSSLGIINYALELPQGIIGLSVHVFIIVALFVPAANAFFKGRHPLEGAMAYPAR